MHVCKQDTRKFGFVGPKAYAAKSWDPSSSFDSISAALTHTQTRAHARESLCASLENNSIQDSHGSPAWAGQHPLLDVPSLHQAEPNCFLYIYIYTCMYIYIHVTCSQADGAGRDSARGNLLPLFWVVGFRVGFLLGCVSRRFFGQVARRRSAFLKSRGEHTQTSISQ